MIATHVWKGEELMFHLDMIDDGILDVVDINNILFRETEKEKTE